MRQSITLIGCGKAKQPDAWNGLAKDLYTGCLFKARRHFAERIRILDGSPWAIVSAEHGLVAPGQLLCPYNTTIKDLSKLQRSKWALDVADSVLSMRILTRAIDPKNTSIALHIGRDYAELLIPVLEAVGFGVIWVTKGMSQGAQLKWYSGIRKLNGETK